MTRLEVARQRKAKRRKRAAKKSEQKRTCPSGKRGFRYEGEARAYDTKGGLNTYRCPDCKEWHLADPIGRKQRRRAARGE